MTWWRSQQRAGNVSAVLLALLAVACTTTRLPPPPPLSPTPTASSDRPLAAGLQRQWVRGVGVDVPAHWPRDALKCGLPRTDTIVVTTIGWTYEHCRASVPKNISVVWIGDYLGGVSEGAVFARHALTAADVANLHATVINGLSAFRGTWHAPDGGPLDVIVLPHRHVFVFISTTDRELDRQIADSLQAVDTDPATDCAVHTNAYDDVRALPAASRLEILVGRPASATACYYVDDWLEGAVSMSSAATNRLVRAMRAAGAAPISDACAGVPEGDLRSPGPMALTFRDPDGDFQVVVARIVACHGWNSYVTNGTVTKRMNRAVLDAIPRLWGFIAPVLPPEHISR